MSSRHRRSMTLKRFDALYRRGQRKNAATSGSKQSSTPESVAEDMRTGSAQSVTGIAGTQLSGPEPLRYTIQGGTWERLSEQYLILARQRELERLTQESIRPMAQYTWSDYLGAYTTRASI